MPYSMRADGAMVLKCSDASPALLRNVLQQRGWLLFDAETMDPGQWNLSWRNMRYKRSEYRECDPCSQRLNHFKASGHLTRKDKLLLALRKMLLVNGRVYDFSPQSFILPNEYTKFVHQYSKDNAEDEASVWICKPADMSRGRKIFLIRDLSELHYDQRYVIQKYVANPLTIGGYKLDLRVYVLVKSFSPLRVYVYEDGLCRFGTEKYDSNLQEIGNLYSHLTNSSINKKSMTYGEDKDIIGPGCKWDFSALRAWYDETGRDFERTFERISDVVVLTLLTALNEVSSAENNQACFELFGFDILLDESLKPWLIEVNCAPALGVDCPADEAVKVPLIHDMVDALQFQPYDAFDEERKSAMERKQQLEARRAHLGRSGAGLPKNPKNRQRNGGGGGGEGNSSSSSIKGGVQSGVGRGRRPPKSSSASGSSAKRRIAQPSSGVSAGSHHPLLLPVVSSNRNKKSLPAISADLER